MHSAHPPLSLPLGRSRALLPAASLLALLSLLLCFASTPVSATCADPSPLNSTHTVHVAILVWVADAPRGLFRGNLSDTRHSTNGLVTSLSEAFMLGVELYVNKMRARGGVLPLPSGKTTNGQAAASHKRADSATERAFRNRFFSHDFRLFASSICSLCPSQ